MTTPTMNSMRDPMEVARASVLEVVRLSAKLADMTAERDSLRVAVDARTHAVCDCGVSATLSVDEDGLCQTCGCDVVVCADPHSAELVAAMRSGGAA